MRRRRWRRSSENLGRIHPTPILHRPVNLSMWSIAKAPKTRTPIPHTRTNRSQERLLQKEFLEMCKTAVTLGVNILMTEMPSRAR